MDQNQAKTPIAGTQFVRRMVKSAFLVAFLLVLIAVGVALYARIVLDGSGLARLIQPHIESALGKRVTYSSVRLTWLSTVRGRVSLTDVRIGYHADSNATIHIPEAVVDVDFGTVWRGWVTIKAARFSKPAIAVRSESQVSERSPTGSSPLATFILSHLKVAKWEVTDGRLIYSESSRDSADNSGLVLSRVGILVTGLSVHRAKNCIVRGEVSSGHQTGLFEAAGTLDSIPLYGRRWKGRCRLRLTGCPLSSLRFAQPWIGYRLPFSHGSATLALNVTGSSRRYKVDGSVNASHVVLSWEQVFLRNVLLENAWAEFVFNRSGDRMQMEVSQARLPGLNVAGEARLDRISGDDPTLTIALRNADIDLEKSFPLIPMNLLKPEEREQLERAGLKGHVRITGGVWTGKTSDLVNGPSLRGTVALAADLERVSGFVPGLGLPVENATGTVHVNSENMLFRGISLTIGSSPIVLNGSITNLKKTPIVDVFVSMEAQAQDLYPLLTSKAFEGSLTPWLGPMVDPAGGVSVTLDLKGNLNRPKMKGRIALKGFECGIRGFPLSVKDVTGALRFRPTGISVSELQGIVGTSPVVIKGGVTSGAIDLNGRMKLSPADCKKLCRLPANWSVSRRIPISLDVSGTVSEVDLSAAVDLTRTGLKFGSILKKNVGTRLKLQASGTANPEGVVVEEAYLIFAKNRIAATAKIPGEGNAEISLNLPPKGIPTRELIPLLHPSLELQPGGRVEGDATIRLGRSLTPSVDMNLQLTHVSLRLPGFYKRTTGMVAAIRQKGKSFRLALERAKHGSSVLSGALAITGLDNPKVDVELAFSFLDTSDFTAPAGYVSDVTWGDWIRTNPAIRFLARSSGQGFISAAKGKTGLRTFSDFKAKIEGKGGLLKARSWQMRIAAGIVRGSALFDIRKTTHCPLTLDFQADQLRMEQVMMSDPNWMRVEGGVVIQGKLLWNLSPYRANYGMYKTGNIEVRVHDGTVNRFDILSKLFSLINLGSLLRGRLPDLIQQGLPFQSLTWDMEVFGTKWKFKQMKLISDAARINASGMYFSDQGRIDFQVDVSPLVGFDTIFSGLFGNLVTKDGKILTTTFKIRGLYESPDVRLIPFQKFKSSR